MATGYERVRSVVAALAGNWEAARDVWLKPPETGVCSATAGSAAPAQRPGLSAAQHDELLGRIARRPPHRRRPRHPWRHHHAAGPLPGDELGSHGQKRAVEEGDVDDVFSLPRHPCTRRLRAAVAEAARLTS
ncbi:hypothetical protein [Planomonospora sp. ID91781]|uniref:hypothetical protein n=1 Tax=Planomonospora sp. ID91781 TaxID=2738135 RepID=UPI0035A882FF